MIIDFKITNFLSFKDTVEFSMMAKAYQKKENHVHKVPNFPILKLSAIYGSNASGKSNFVKALKLLKLLICKENRSISKMNFHKFKLDKKFKNKPTVFKLTFKTELGNVYEYGLTIGDKVIDKESLYIFEGKKKKLVYNRFRNPDGTYRLEYPGSLIKEETNQIRFQVYQEVLKADKPFLSMAERVENLVDFTDALYWFEDQLQFLFPHFSDNGTFLRSYITNEEFQFKAKDIIINTSGLGIEDIIVNRISINDFFGASETERKLNYISKLENVPFIFFEQDGKEHLIIENKQGKTEVVNLTFVHTSESNKDAFELNEESDGTRRLFHLLPSIIDSIDKNKVYIIDEIDRSMHPILIKNLLEFYTNKFDSDTGQMIFTTHESILMDLRLLRQDEFWFVEKNNNEGSTVMYSLIEFKPRFDLNIRKGYLEGKFGAIPFLSKPSW